jgi:PTH1 family peptidyl-tRNA hydrolase
LAVDEIIRENNFPALKKSSKFNAEISEKNIDGEKIIIVKPQTYMNESGKAVRSLMNFYKTASSDIIIIHDDVDLLMGKIKISQDRGSAGHKGIQSVFDETGNKDFTRIRIGISPDLQKSRKAEDIVLKKIQTNEKTSTKRAIEKAIEAVDIVIKKGLEKAMDKYNV